MSTYDPKLKFNGTYTIIPTCPANHKLDRDLNCINIAQLSKLDKNGTCSGRNQSVAYIQGQEPMCYTSIMGKSDKGKVPSKCPEGSDKNSLSSVPIPDVKNEMCVVNLSKRCKAPNVVDIKNKTCMTKDNKPISPTCPPNSSVYQNERDRNYFCA